MPCRDIARRCVAERPPAAARGQPATASVDKHQPAVLASDHAPFRHRRRRSRGGQRLSRRFARRASTATSPSSRREQHPPYQRPPLSKGYLEGKEGTDAVILHAAEWYGERGLELRTGHRVPQRSIRRATASRSTTGRRSTYDEILLATGAVAAEPRRSRARILPGSGCCARLEDSDALADELRGGGRSLVLIGSGWIGMEVAATARTLGNDVTVLERDAVPLAAAIGAEMGAVFRDLHLAHGVDLRASVKRRGHRRAGPRATASASTARWSPADLVVIGVGAVPNTSLAEEAGIAVSNGILTDARCARMHRMSSRRATSRTRTTPSSSGICAASTGTTRRGRRRRGEVDARHPGLPRFHPVLLHRPVRPRAWSCRATAPLMKDAQIVDTRRRATAREFIAFWHRRRPGRGRR